MDYPATMVFDQNEASDYTSDRNSRTGKLMSNPQGQIYYTAVNKALNSKQRSFSV